MLTPHFSLAELLVTSTGLPNVPGPGVEARLQALCEHVLEPWRALVGPLRVTSGYRSPEVNDELRKRGYSAARTSQHLRGEASDVVPVRAGLDQAWRALAQSDLPIDQAIVYQRTLDRGWIHVSHTARPRRELLVQLVDGKSYIPWSSFVAAGGVLVIAGG